MARITWVGILLGLALAAIALGDAAAADSARRASSALHPGSGMRRASVAAGETAVPFPDAAPRYHNGPGVRCEDCHILHASKQHPPGDKPTLPGETYPMALGPNPYMLKTPDSLDLCLSCHDGHADIPDVVNADANGLADRSAGFFDPPGSINPRGHNLGRNLAGPVSSDLCSRCHASGGAEMAVTCVDCHNPHGNGVARNLQWASDPEATPDLGLFVSPGATGMQRYETANVAYGSLDSNVLREVSNMCLDCHHVFSGGEAIDPDGDGIHSRHPAYDSERNAPNSIAMGAADGGSSPAHWSAGVGSGFEVPRVRTVVSGATGFGAAHIVDAQRNGVFCLTCHKAHGSDQAFGMTWPVSDGYRAPGCDQCHGVAETASLAAP